MAVTADSTSSSEENRRKCAAQVSFGVGGCAAENRADSRASPALNCQFHRTKFSCESSSYHATVIRRTHHHRASTCSSGRIHRAALGILSQLSKSVPSLLKCRFGGLLGA